MNESASLLLGGVVPGMTAPTGLQPGAQAPGAGPTASTGFQSLLMETLAGSAPQVGVVESRAGQQAVASAQKEPVSVETNAEQVADDGGLLGSIDMAASLAGAAQVVVAAVASQPQAQIVEPVVVSDTAAETPVPAGVRPQQTAPISGAQIVPAETAQVPGMEVADDGAQVAVTDLPQGMTPVETPEAYTGPIPTAQTEVVPNAPQSAVPSEESVEATNVAQTSVVDDQPSEMATTGATAEQADVAQVSPEWRVKESLSDKVHITVNGADGSDVRLKEHMKYSLRIQATGDAKPMVGEGSKVSSTSLPEAQAPVVASTVTDYRSLRLKVDVAAKSDGRVRLKESAMIIGQPMADLVSAASSMPTALATDQGKLVIGQTVLGMQSVQSSLEGGVSPSQVDVVSEKQTGDQGNNAGAFVSALQEAGPSVEKSVNGASQSSGFNAPDKVIEQKVMHQIVKSAKVQMVDGGSHMSLRLDPPHLGVLNMSVTAQQGSVVANIQTSTEAARYVIEADLSGLKQALADAGVAVDSINVSMNNATDQSGTPFGDQQTGRRSHGARSNRGFQELLGGDGEPAPLRSRVGQAIGEFDHLA